jgi:hypothetical protein
MARATRHPGDDAPRWSMATRQASIIGAPPCIGALFAPAHSGCRNGCGFQARPSHGRVASRIARECWPLKFLAEMLPWPARRSSGKTPCGTMNHAHATRWLITLCLRLGAPTSTRCLQRAPRFLCCMGWLRTSGKQTLQLRLMHSIGNP